MLSSSEYLDSKRIALFARLMSAQRKAGSPERRGLSITWLSVLLIAACTRSITSRTDAPRPVPMLSAGGSGWVASAAARCARAMSRTST